MTFSAATLRDLYEGPTVPLDSGADRARRQLRMIEPVLRRAEAQGTALTIVDVGCGEGTATGLLAERARGHTVVGVDWSEQALSRARRRGLTLVRSGLDAPGLPFADSTVDIAVLSEVIEHLVDTDAALDEMARILRPGGSLLLSTPNLAAWFNRALLLAGVQPVFTEVSLQGIYGRPGREVVGHLRIFTRRALVGLLRGHRMEIVELRGARYPDTPGPLRPLDRLFQHLPALAADLLVHARTPDPSRACDPPQAAAPHAATRPGASSPEESMPIARDLFDLLVCPVDKGPLHYDPQTDGLYNPRLRRRYPIVAGIPHLLADRAEQVGPAEHRRIMRLQPQPPQPPQAVTDGEGQDVGQGDGQVGDAGLPPRPEDVDDLPVNR